VKVAEGRFAKKGDLGYKAGNPPSGRIIVSGKDARYRKSQPPRLAGFVFLGSTRSYLLPYKRILESS
jgi:hypothetical protein